MDESKNPAELVTEPEACLRVWAQYFKELLNQTSTVAPDISASLRDQEEVREEYDGDYTIDEVRSALNLMKDRRATGVSGVPIEVFKNLEDQNLGAVRDRVNAIWQSGMVPQQL